MRIRAAIRAAGALWAAMMAGVVCAQAAEDVRRFSLDWVQWDYRERAGATPGYPATPMHSQARGWSARFGGELADALDDAGVWRMQAEGWVMPGLNRPVERWQLNGGVQRNRLAVLDGGAELALLWSQGAWRVGASGAWTGQRQRRDRFTVNNAPVAASAEERIQAGWLGGVVAWHSRDGALRVAGGYARPVWVRVRNSVVGRFSGKGGWRGVALLDWRVTRYDGFDWHVRGRWEERALDGELRPYGLWPANRFRLLSLGLELDW